MSVKKIDPGAYNALADALSAIFWNKRPFERYLRGVLRGAPEIIANLDFNKTKREIASDAVDYLMESEDKHQNLTLSIMLNISEMDTFPNLRIQSDAAKLTDIAIKAVKVLQEWTNHHSGVALERAESMKRIAVAVKEAQKSRVISQGIEQLYGKFMRMHQSSNPQGRGYEFEKFLNQLFGLFDLEPRAAYSLDTEQIDGAFSFDTDDYILEARWRSEQVSREYLDAFKVKIGRRGKNALGLCISINGFSSDALYEYRKATPFIVMDGMDMFAILEGRIRLDDLILRKKRHANETGDCFFSAKDMF